MRPRRMITVAAVVGGLLAASAGPAAAASPATTTFTVEAGWLWKPYLLAVAASIVLLVVATFAAFRLTPTDQRQTGPTADERAGVSWLVTKSLAGLPSGWSFKDSWASNVTVGATILTTVFGTSSVLKDVLGDQSTGPLAVMAIAGAISTGMVLAAAALTKTAADSDDAPFMAGVLVAALLTFTAAFGQLFIVWGQALRLGLSNAEYLVPVVGTAALLLLIAYGLVSITKLIKFNLLAPKPTPPSDALVAAQAIVAAIQQLPGAGVAAAVQPDFSTILETLDAHPRRALVAQGQRRSALF